MWKNLFSLRKRDSYVALVSGKTVTLRTLTPQDAQEVTALVTRNKYYWSQHEPLHNEQYYLYDTQYRKIVESMHLMRANREFTFGIFENSSERLIGQISLFSIKRMPYSSGFVGYSIDEAYAGKGYASEALQLVKKFAFQTVKLHRLEAYVSPKNTGSIRVLEKARFVREGLLRKLLFINGVWEDHYLYSYLQED